MPESLPFDVPAYLQARAPTLDGLLITRTQAKALHRQLWGRPMPQHMTVHSWIAIRDAKSDRIPICDLLTLRLHFGKPVVLALDISDNFLVDLISKWLAIQEVVLMAEFLGR